LIFTEKAGWFDDDVAIFCRDVIFPSSGAKYMLFTSDVRSDKAEDSIIRDMRDQMRWTMLSGCTAYMHKFRIPFLSHPSGTSPSHDDKDDHIYQDLSHLPQGQFRLAPSNASNAKKRRFQFPYLDGKLYIELYGRQRTSELRLMGYASSSNSFSPYNLRMYDHRTIDDAMGTFNILYRSHARYAYVSPHTPPPLDEEETMASGNTTVMKVTTMPANYENVGEHAILWDCARALLSSVSSSPSSTKRNEEKEDILSLAAILHDRVRELMMTRTVKDPLVCPLISADVELRKKMPKVDVHSYAPHILEWARRIRDVQPHSAIPRRFITDKTDK